MGVIGGLGKKGGGGAAGQFGRRPSGQLIGHLPSSNMVSLTSRAKPSHTRLYRINSPSLSSRFSDMECWD
jgi:hypothetical protein